jgi:hypothetical protein
VTTNESWRRFLDAGTAVGQVTLAKANEIAKGLMASEQETRERAWRDLDELGRSGRQLGEQLVDLAKSRLTRELGHLGSLEETLDWVADLVSVRTRRPEPPTWPGDADRLESIDGVAKKAKDAKPKQKKPKKKEKAAAAAGRRTKDGGSGRKEHKQGDGKKAAPEPERVVTRARSDRAGRR